MDLKVSTQICPSPIVEEETQVSPPSPMYLILVDGGTTGTMFRVGRQTSLGRAVDNTYQFHDATVSRRHAALSVDEEGQAWLTDLGSSNGTLLDGRPIPRHKPVRLEDGSRIQIGASLILKYVSLDACDERFQREMFERTVRDNLTGLFNRGYFMEQIGPLCERNTLRNLGTAVLMVDVDHFKRINDAHGHDVGDAALREVAKTLREATRTEDLVARYGGEEFIVALPVSSVEQALDRAEQIRSLLASRPVRAGRKEFRITASLGVSCTTTGRRRPPSALIATADIALYEAKRAGRDRVVDAGRVLAEGERRTESCDAVAV